MAHNEEKLIHRAVSSALLQTVPPGYSVIVLVVANACTDKTEEIVLNIQREYPEKVVLLSTPQKGKTRAINEAIQWLVRFSDTHRSVPYVVFLDADCRLIGSDVLIRFGERFEIDPRLGAISATCVPDVLFSDRKDIVSRTYRSMHKLAAAIRFNTISGMCYAIRLPLLTQINFPDFPFAEDMYVCSRLDGWFIKASDIQIVFSTPSTLRDEIKRRRRQEVSTARYHAYYSYLQLRGTRVQLYDHPLHPDYRWGRWEQNPLKAWLGLKDISHQVFVLVYLIIRAIAIISTRLNYKNRELDDFSDYWDVIR
jgi:glycosyltransferase involved in cell wall biosynthesis